MQKALGGAHAIATPLVELHLHHGTLIGILLPHILPFNKGHADADCGDLRDVMQVSDDQELHDRMTAFVARLGLPTICSCCSKPCENRPNKFNPSV